MQPASYPRLPPRQPVPAVIRDVEGGMRARELPPAERGRCDGYGNGKAAISEYERPAGEKMDECHTATKEGMS